MKQLFIVANWKEFMLEGQAKQWVQQMENGKWKMADDKTVIVCPPFTLLSEMRQLVAEKNLPLQLGTQNVSAFPQSAHTGEESADMIKDFATYVIVGHSERRAMGETDDMINEKIVRSMEQGLHIILCVSNEQEIESSKANIQRYNEKQQNGPQMIVAYEPLEAIGSGNPDTPEHANEFSQMIKQVLGNVAVLYGGSVNAENVHLFTSQDAIDGVLVGGASLDAEKFGRIIQNA